MEMFREHSEIFSEENNQNMSRELLVMVSPSFITFLYLVVNNLTVVIFNFKLQCVKRVRIALQEVYWPNVFSSCDSRQQGARLKCVHCKVFVYIFVVKTGRRSRAINCAS